MTLFYFCDKLLEKLIIKRQRRNKCIIHKQQIKEQIMANESLSTIPDLFEKQGKAVKFLHFFIVDFLFFLLGDFYDLELDCFFIFDGLIFWLYHKELSFLLKVFFYHFSGVGKWWSGKFKPFLLNFWWKFFLLSLNFANYIFDENLIFFLHKV